MKSTLARAFLLIAAVLLMASGAIVGRNASTQALPAAQTQPNR